MPFNPYNFTPSYLREEERFHVFSLETESGKGKKILVQTPEGCSWCDLLEDFISYLKACGYEVTAEDMRDYFVANYPEEESPDIDDTV